MKNPELPDLKTKRKTVTQNGVAREVEVLDTAPTAVRFADLLPSLMANVKIQPQPMALMCAYCTRSEQHPECQDGWKQLKSGAARCQDFTQHLENVALMNALRASEMDDSIYDHDWQNVTVEHDSWQLAKGYSDAILEVIAEGLSLVFVGEVGRGKTFAGVLICRQAVMLGKTASKIRFSDWYKQIQASISNKDLPTEDASLKALTRVDVLLIDEIEDNLSVYAEALLLTLINRRYLAGKTTIFTTNLTEDEFTRAVGDKCESRINQNSDWIIFDGPDFRKEAAKSGSRVRDMVRQKVGAA